MFRILKTNKGDFVFVEECGGAGRKKWWCRKKQPKNILEYNAKNQNLFQKTVSSCTSISSCHLHTQNENTFLSLLCHPHIVVSRLCNSETHLEKDFWIM